MKTLSEIQNEIKTLSMQLNQLAIGIQNIRPEVRNNDVLDMKKIKFLAQKYPIEGHALVNYEDFIKQRYLTLLILVARIQQNEIEKGMLLINRIAYGAAYQGDIADIIKNSYTLSENSMEEVIETFCTDRIKMLLVFDMLLISAEKKHKEVLQFVAQISYMIGISENEMKFLSNLAVVVLQNDLNKYVENGISYDQYNNIFSCYVKNLNIDRKLIKVPKSVLIGLGDILYNVILDIKEGEIMLLETGETICMIKDNATNINTSSLDGSMDRRLEKKMSDIKGEYKLCSPASGKVYMFSNKVSNVNLSVGVITHPLDNEENARAWFEANK